MKPREFWIKGTQLNNLGMDGFRYADVEISVDPKCGENYNDFKEAIHVIEKSAYDDLEIRLARTVNAAYYALLEMSAWMGIPENKRMAQINELMSNVRYCAENDLRHLDKQITGGEK